MNHLDESVLNEYLDGELPEAERTAVEEHLTLCSQCRQKAEALQQAFIALAGLPELPLAADLTPRVMAQIGHEAASTPHLTPGFRALLVAQAIAALLMLVFLWPSAQGMVAGGQRLVAEALAPIETSAATFWPGVAGWIAAARDQWQASRPMFDLAQGQWATLIGLALVVWLIGNQRLLAADNAGETRWENRLE